MESLMIHGAIESKKLPDPSNNYDPISISIKRRQYQQHHCLYCFYNPFGMFFVQYWGLFNRDLTLLHSQSFTFKNSAAIVASIFNNFGPCGWYRIKIVASVTGFFETFRARAIAQFIGADG
jgi:hypothetical protein